MTSKTRRLIISFFIMVLILFLYREKIFIFFIDTNQNIRLKTAIANERKQQHMELLYEGLPNEGYYLKKELGLIVSENGGNLFERWMGLDFVWRGDVPSQQRIRMLYSNGKKTDVLIRPMFCACAVQQKDNKRIFFFATKRGLIDYDWLEDDKVSWYYQTKIGLLNEKELKKEFEYRKKKDITFPRTITPGKN